jgi:hypothetical protein
MYLYSIIKSSNQQLWRNKTERQVKDTIKAKEQR